MPTSSKAMRRMFLHEGNSYSGRILSDTSIKPHLYWFLFDDDAMQSTFPDDIAFSYDNNQLQPVRMYPNSDLVDAVQKEIEEYLVSEPR